MSPEAITCREAVDYISAYLLQSEGDGNLLTTYSIFSRKEKMEKSHTYLITGIKYKNAERAILTLNSGKTKTISTLGGGCVACSYGSKNQIYLQFNHYRFHFCLGY